MLDTAALFDHTALTCATVGAVVLLLVNHLKTRRRCPPGPPGYPVVGNWFDLPPPDQKPWLRYFAWSKKYGSDIIHLKVFGTHLLYVNSAEAATALFERKGSLYSDRPTMPMVNNLMGFDWHLGFMHNDSNWKKDRKMFTQEYNPTSAAQFQESETKHVHTLLKNLLVSPEHFMTHMQLMSSGIVAETTFGYQVQPAETIDPFISVAEQAVGGLIKAALFGSYTVDFLPSLSYLPSWIPFKRQASTWRKAADTAVTAPLDLVKSAIEAGGDTPSLARKLLEQHPDDEAAIRRVGTAIFAQGSIATVATVQSFVLFMAQNPDAQRKAQAELDDVLQGSRLPTFADISSLPYLNAVLKETLRLAVTVPLSFPRRLSSDDQYKGMTLSAGSVVVPNTWAILRDESIYGPQTDKFNPSRFLDSEGRLDKSVRDPDAAFGYGLRRCPGRHFALQELSLAMASVLAAFTISDPPDGDVEFTSGFLRYPLPFKCSIKTRSDNFKGLVQQL